MHLVVLSYEFTYSPFSGNGVLARSLVKSLLMHGCCVTVFCCRPAPSVHHESSTMTMISPDRPLKPPEITQKQHERLAVYAVTLNKEKGWRRLDDGAAWQEFHLQGLRNEKEQQNLSHALMDARAVLAIDWTGACAWRSILMAHDLFSESRPPPALVYLNFRVYSSGVADETKHAMYNEMERAALKGASVIIALSEKDKVSLLALLADDDFDKGTREVHVLLPPLRGDVEQLASFSLQELESMMPPEAAVAIQTKSTNERRCFVTCVARLGPEKDVMRFVRFVEATRDLWTEECGFIPLLAGASSDVEYAQNVKEQLRRVQPNSIIIDHFLSPEGLAAIFSRAALNFHPCEYEAYGMTIVEAASFGVPSIVAAGGHVGASAIVGNGASFEFDMSTPGILSEEVLKEIQGAMEDREQLQSVGEKAKKRALSWDEAAYGKALLQFISV